MDIHLNLECTGGCNPSSRGEDESRMGGRLASGHIKKLEVRGIDLEAMVTKEVRPQEGILTLTMMKSCNKCQLAA